jgi:hypothetical protein
MKRQFGAGGKNPGLLVLLSLCLTWMSPAAASTELRLKHQRPTMLLDTGGLQQEQPPPGEGKPKETIAQVRARLWVGPVLEFSDFPGDRNKHKVPVLACMYPLVCSQLRLNVHFSHR